jgi:hypothetical protein
MADGFNLCSTDPVVENNILNARVERSLYLADLARRGAAQLRRRGPATLALASIGFLIFAGFASSR